MNLIIITLRVSLKTFRILQANTFKIIRIKSYQNRPSFVEDGEKCFGLLITGTRCIRARISVASRYSNIIIQRSVGLCSAVCKQRRLLLHVHNMTTSEAIKFMTRRCVYFQWRLSRVICQPPRTAHPPTWRARTFNPVWCLSLANDITGLAIMPRSPYYQSFNDEIITTSSVLLRPFLCCRFVATASSSH